MARFSFVVPPFTGHINPTLAVGSTLIARGHDVAWIGHAEVLAPVIPNGGTLLALPAADDPARIEELRVRGLALRGLAGFKFLWQDVLLPLANATFAPVRAAINAFNPDAIIVDQQALAGGLAARDLGRRWATFSTAADGAIDPLSELPTVLAWRNECWVELQRRHGLDPIDDMDRSPHLFIALTTPELVAPGRSFPPHYAFVGPALNRPVLASDFPWHELSARPRVLVSLGTLNTELGAKFFAHAATAFEQLGIGGVFVTTPSSLMHIPRGVIVRERIPQLALLPELDAVVCHGGNNTVCETLAHGLPLVIAPIKQDQTTVAQQVVDAGAGIRLRFARSSAEQLAQAIATVLQEPRFRRAAANIRDAFVRAGGAERAASLLEAFAHHA